MKLLVTIILFVYFGGGLYSQIDSTIYKNLKLGVYINENFDDEGLSINPGVIIAQNKHNLIFSFKKYQISTYKINPRYENKSEYGYNIIYKYKATNLSKRVSFYWLCNFEFFKRNERLESTFYNENNSIDFKHKVYNFGISPGYGIGIRLYKNLILLQSFDIGIQMIRDLEKYSYELNNIEYKVTSTNPGLNRPSGIINLTLGLQYMF